MSGFRPSVIASVVLGLMTRMVRFVGAILIIVAGVPKCFKQGVLVVLVSPMIALSRKRDGKELLRITFVELIFGQSGKLKRIVDKMDQVPGN
jgi:hypothetical protein